MSRYFYKFLIVGLFGFFVDLGAFMLLSAMGLPASLARLCSLLVAANSTWYLNRGYTFQNQAAVQYVLKEWLRYLVSIGFGAIINFLVFWGLLYYTPVAISPVPALATASVIALFFNFFAAKNFAFKRPQCQNKGQKQ